MTSCWIYTLVFVISLKLLALLGAAKSNSRSKRGNFENFNVLLSIYKMNPLKHSDVFKAFSNRLLLPGPDERRAELNFNINESREKKHGTNNKLKTKELINYARHSFNNDSPIHKGVTPEKFNAGTFLSKLISMDHMKFDNRKSDSKVNDFDWSTITYSGHKKNCIYKTEIQAIRKPNGPVPCSGSLNVKFDNRKSDAEVNDFDCSTIANSGPKENFIHKTEIQAKRNANKDFKKYDLNNEENKFPLHVPETIVLK